MCVQGGSDIMKWEGRGRGGGGRGGGGGGEGEGEGRGRVIHIVRHTVTSVSVKLGHFTHELRTYLCLNSSFASGANTSP